MEAVLIPNNRLAVLLQTRARIPPEKYPRSVNLLPPQSYQGNQDGGSGVRRMRSKPSLHFGILGTACVLGAFVLALQVEVLAMPAVRGIDPASINRTVKSDRLPVVPAAVRTLPAQHAEQPRLPEGCVDASNWHKDKIYTAEVAGRCVG